MMSYDELNAFIENYLVNDKSQRALLLTAPWGTGKSFYIKNKLCPYLKFKKLKYAVVSLYGMSSVKDVSKSLYLEIRTKGILDKNEKANATWIFGKTIAKGIASFFNVDLNQNEDDLKRLYSSIDLSNHLIVLEDLERTNLDIVEVLGYINNLVEQDGVKVLVVANESEILKYEEKPSKSQTRFLTKESEEYLKIKEKTIGDTIHFSSNITESISDIVRSFDNPIFNKLLEEKDPSGEVSFSRRVYQQLLALKCCNFRSVLYACQKMDEVTKKFQCNFNFKFVHDLFIGTICYSIKVNNDGNKIWDSQSFASQNLGTFAYPLLRPMYDYIENHLYNYDKFKEAESIYLKASEISVADKKLAVLYSYYDYSEKELVSTLDFILDNLKKDTLLVHDEYVTIANYLISVKYEVGFADKIDDCISLMLRNAKQSIDGGHKINTFIKSGIQLGKGDQTLELKSFINGIEEYQKELNRSLPGFSYNPQDILPFYESTIRNKTYFTDGNGFFNKLDLDKLLAMLLHSSSKEIETFRDLIQHVYFGFSNIKDFFMCDLSALEDFSHKLDCVNFDENSVDKIQKLQLNWLKENLEEIISRLNDRG